MGSRSRSDQPHSQTALAVMLTLSKSFRLVLPWVCSIHGTAVSPYPLPRLHVELTLADVQTTICTVYGRVKTQRLATLNQDTGSAIKAYPSFQRDHPGVSLVCHPPEIRLLTVEYMPGNLQNPSGWAISSSLTRARLHPACTRDDLCPLRNF